MAGFGHSGAAKIGSLLGTSQPGENIQFQDCAADLWGNSNHRPEQLPAVRALRDAVNSSVENPLILTECERRPLESRFAARPERLHIERVKPFPDFREFLRAEAASVIQQFVIFFAYGHIG
jgi:hypothetical protein